MAYYKILRAPEWEALAAAGQTPGAPIDLRDGYVHLSTAAQVEETAAKHFAGEDGLMLLAVDESRLREALRWEPSRGGALFPHLYAALAMSAVTRVTPIDRAEDLPAELP